MGQKSGITLLDFHRQRKGFSYQIPDGRAKFHQNRSKIATVRARTDRQR